jgi:Protein of unknown function (DUF1275)
MSNPASVGNTNLFRQTPRALARVLVSGYVDSYALLNFGVFASFMTGNTTTGGMYGRTGQSSSRCS